MSRLFSRVSAITSRTDKYRFPLLTSDSSRGVLVKFAGENTRLSIWKGRRIGPTNGGAFGIEIVTSDDCPKAVKPSSSNGKTRRMQFIGLGKRLLNITNRVQFRFHSIRCCNSSGVEPEGVRFRYKLSVSGIIGP